MNYIFKILEQEMPNGSNYTQPFVTFLDNIPNFENLSDDLSNLDDVDYLNEIVTSLQALIDSTETEPYEWGHEIYEIICDAEFCRCHEIYLATGANLAVPELVLPTAEVLQLIVDWRAFVIQWRIDYLGQDPNLFV